MPQFMPGKTQKLGDARLFSAAAMSEAEGDKDIAFFATFFAERGTTLHTQRVLSSIKLF
jgi:hypothetical protein